jgi:hypothetical protein
MRLVNSIADGIVEIRLENIDAFLSRGKLLFRCSIKDIPSTRTAIGQLLAGELSNFAPIYVVIFVADIFQDPVSIRLITAILKNYGISVIHPDGLILNCDAVDEASDLMTLLLLLYSDFVVYSVGLGITIEFSHDNYLLVKSQGKEHKSDETIELCERLERF